MQEKYYESAKQLLERTENYLFDPNFPGALKTGFNDLDNLTGGLNKGELVCIAGRPSMGKTGFVLSMIKDICINRKKKCLYFSLDLSGLRLIRRLVFMLYGADPYLCREDAISMPEVKKAIDDIKQAPLYINDIGDISIEEIKESCKKLSDEEKVDLVIVDYFQLISSCKNMGTINDTEKTNRFQELRRIAVDLQCPVIVLSQLPRTVEKRKDHRPVLSDLRVYEGIERFSDKIIFIYRDAYYYEDTKRPDIADITVAKNHMGEIGTIWLKYSKSGSFSDIPDYLKPINWY